MIKFILNNELIETTTASGMAMLDFIRKNQQLKGSKLVCKEGECGACTVMVGQFDNGKMNYQSMTSCIMPLVNANGKHIVTIEGLNMDELSPVQQAMLDAYGSQCGFCSPGFVVSLSGCLMSNESVSQEQIIESIDGNICRCTGYKSIERAALTIVEKVKKDFDTISIKGLAERGYIPTYFKNITKRLEAIQPNQNEVVNGMKLGGGSDLYVQRPYEMYEQEAVAVYDQKELKQISIKNGLCTFGASLTMGDLYRSEVFKKALPRSKYIFKLLSSTQIRNMATIGGNLINASPIGDFTVLLLGLNAEITLNKNGKRRVVALKDFYLGYKKMDLKEGEYLEQIQFKTQNTRDYHFEKVSQRNFLDIASVNFASNIKTDDNNIVQEIHLAVGGVGPIPMYLHKTVAFLNGKKLNQQTINAAIEILNTEVSPISDTRGSAEYKRLLATQLFLAQFDKTKAAPALRQPIIDTSILKEAPNSLNIDAVHHLRGKTQYVDDMAELAGTLFAKAYYAQVAHGTITHLDYSKAEELSGVVKILTYKDIPGENQVGGIVPDEPLLAEKEVHYIGQPILLILAKNEIIAHKALSLIDCQIREKRIIVDPKEAKEAGELLVPPRTFSMGDAKAAFENCTYVFEGETNTGGQEHLYLETQGAYAIPQGNGSLKIHSSTQGPTQVQKTVARVLGCSMNRIEIDVNRIGGGFGGKEDQASMWGAMVALGATITDKPVKYILERQEDLQMTGRRHPYKSDYKIGLDKNYKIIAFEADYYQDGGASTDLSPAVLERTLFHATNSYFIPNTKLTAYCCRTNVPPNTAFRGFGGPQGMFVIEAAIHHAAKKIGIAPEVIQEKNLLFDGAEFPYGQIAAETEVKNCWQQACQRYELDQLKKEIAVYNQNNQHSKKGMAIMPLCFGISFTNTPMNHARALLHIYNDGSVGISTGAVEMGQGVNAKMVQLAARAFGIPASQIKLESTNTTRVANTSPTAASATADLNGKALQDACDQVLNRLKKVARKEWNLEKKNTILFSSQNVHTPDKNHNISWKELINLAFVQRVNLSAKGHYATAVIYFDKSKEKGHPFAYHVFGTAIVSCTVDCVRGTYDFDAVKIVHDFGTSMNKLVDLGQIEGGLVQGMGWMTMEDVVYNEKGQLKSHSLANYKIPDIHFAPKELQVQFLNTQSGEPAILKSKAVGEPPLMYGIGAYFALYNAVLAYNPKADLAYISPMTTERILMGLHIG